MKQILSYFLTFLLLFTFLTGCGPGWKKKFVRKRAEKKPEQVFTYEPREYQGEPSGELYKRRFIFWKAWQEELVTKLGDNKLADIRAFEEALENLEEMKRYLRNGEAAGLEEHSRRLENFCNLYRTGNLDVVRLRQMRQDLDRLMLKIDKAFRYSRVREYIIKDK